jgi:hypothetical protein
VAHPDFSARLELDFPEDLSLEDEPLEEPESFDVEELVFESSDLDEDGDFASSELPPSADFFSARLLP